MNRKDLARAATEVNAKERAFRDLMALGRQYLGIILLAEEIGEAVTLEETLGALRANVAGVESDLVAIKDRLEQTNREYAASAEAFEALVANKDSLVADAEERLAAAVRRIASAERDADDLLARAKERASGVVADAVGRAAGIVADATRKANEDSAAITAAATERVQNLDDLINGRHETLKTVDKQVAAAEYRLSEIRAAISRIASQ